ncbi:MAG: RMD1 family protein [Gammaproteobacteria bacterium]|jgi:uncharacterized Rmd1/YagE family protein
MALFAESRSDRPVSAEAVFLGGRPDLKVLEKRHDVLSTLPLTLRLGEGAAVLFRYGAVVFFGVGEGRVAEFIEELKGLIAEPASLPETEAVELTFDPGREERLHLDGTINLASSQLERLQVVAHVLAKSTVLAYYEQLVARLLVRLEPVSADLSEKGQARASVRDLLRKVGNVLLTRTRMVGRVEIAEKPELTWDAPDLDRLYERLHAEYELRERDITLDRKLALIADTAETVLELLRHRQSLRVEWYIVILIVIEVVLFIYELFLTH